MWVNAFANASEYAREYRWIYSWVHMNLLAGMGELTLGYRWSCSQVHMNLPAITLKFTRESIASEWRCIWVISHLYDVQEKYIPLYITAKCGHNDVVKLLLAANVDTECICIVSDHAWLMSTSRINYIPLSISCIYICTRLVYCIYM